MILIVGDLESFTLNLEDPITKQIEMHCIKHILVTKDNLTN